MGNHCGSVFGRQSRGRGSFLAGISFYRLGDFKRALADFQRGFLLAVDADSRARAYLWIGKAQEKLGDAAKPAKRGHRPRLSTRPTITAFAHVTCCWDAFP